jgi:hypothetical protein
MPRIWAVAVLLCCLSAIGHSQVPNLNIFGGYSHLNTSDVGSPGGTGMNGFEGSVERKVFPFVSLVGDFGWNFQSTFAEAEPGLCTPLPGSQPGGCVGSIPPSSVAEYTFLFGPRVSFKIKDFRPFVHALVGGAHVNESAYGAAGSSTALADALGGGVDYRLTRQFSWRIQVDAVQTRFFNTSQTNLHISTGIVFRF